MQKENSSLAIIVDDHKLFASTFAMLLEKTHSFSYVTICDKQSEVLAYASANKSRSIFLFLDYFIPGINTHYLISDVKKVCPRVKIAIVSNLSNLGLIRKVMMAKIDGIISKVDDIEEVISFLNNDFRSKPFLSRTIKKIVTENGVEGILYPNFTARELDVLSLIAGGNNMEEIAQKLSLSKHTIITYRRNMLTKSGFRSITELVAYAIKSGIVEQ